MQAFDEGEQEAVARLAIELTVEPAEPKTLSLVAEIQGMVVGHVAFSPVRTEVDGEAFGYILAPLAVMPACQRGGVGSELVRSGLDWIRTTPACIVFVYGDPNYYKRFGFSAEAAGNFAAPYQLEFPLSWLALTLASSRLPVARAKVHCVRALSSPDYW